jgi:hypothetical protein
MESNNFASEEVIASGDAGWDSHRDLASVGNELINSPLTARVTILVDLEPSRSRFVGQSIADFGHVDHDRALMRRVNDIAGA